MGCYTHSTIQHCGCCPNQESPILIPDNMLLWKLTFKPDTLTNNTKTALKARTFAQLFSPTNKVSSANCKWETDNPLCM